MRFLKKNRVICFSQFIACADITSSHLMRYLHSAKRHKCLFSKTDTNDWHFRIPFQEYRPITRKRKRIYWIRWVFSIFFLKTDIGISYGYEILIKVYIIKGFSRNTFKKKHDLLYESLYKTSLLTSLLLV